MTRYQELRAAGYFDAGLTDEERDAIVAGKPKKATTTAQLSGLVGNAPEPEPDPEPEPEPAAKAKKGSS